MKGIVSFVLATGLGLSSLSAAESKTLGQSAINQSDKGFLFASNEAKTQVLSEQEMSETRGDGVLLALFATSFATSAGKALGTAAGVGFGAWLGDRLGLW